MLPSTYTLDIPRRGKPFRAPYSLKGPQQIDTTTLDIPARGLPFYAPFKASKAFTLAMAATLQSLPTASTVAGQSTLERTGGVVGDITKDGSTVFASNTGGNLTQAVTISLQPNQVLIVRYAGKSQGDALGMTFGGRPLTKLVSEFTPTGDGVSAWILTTPAVGINNLIVTVPAGGKFTGVAIDKYYNVKQTTNLTNAHISGFSNRANTYGLDFAYRGRPARMPYAAYGTSAMDTTKLDLASMGRPARTLYISVATQKRAALGITPATANNTILDAISVESAVTALQTQDFNFAKVAAGQRFTQSGGPTAKSMEWDILYGGAWQHIALALEKALNTQNTLAFEATLSRVGLKTLAAQVTLEGLRVSLLAAESTLESDYKNLLQGAQLVALGVIVDTPNYMAMTASFQAVGANTIGMLAILFLKNYTARRTVIKFNNKKTVIKFK